MKTKTTKDLEKLLEQHFNTRNDFYVFECTIGWYGKEIVDCIMYNCQREIYCFEIKQSKQDFYSKNVLTFIGNKNYFVMPYSLYEQVKEDIPEGIGVYVAIDKLEKKQWEETNEYGIKITCYKTEPINGMGKLYCIKNAKRQELKADKEVILSSMLRSMQRDRIPNIWDKVILKKDIIKKIKEIEQDGSRIENTQEYNKQINLLKDLLKND